MKQLRWLKNSKKRPKESGQYYYLFAFFMVTLILTTGCTQHIPTNQTENFSMTSTPGQVASLQTPTGNITPDKAIGVIQNFTGMSDLTPKYTKTIHDSNNVDIYKFESDAGLFYVNSKTGRVQGALFYNASPTSNKVVDLDQAYTIAESYAQQKFPDLWNTSDQKGIENTARYRYDYGGGNYEYRFEWRDDYYTPTNSSTGRKIITGPNIVSMTVLPNGAIESYNELVIPVDPTLNLQPDLTENEAWEIANAYYTSQGVANVTPTADGSKGLVILNDNNNVQHLTWLFEDYNNERNGGQIWIDAHTGTVVQYLPVL